MNNAEFSRLVYETYVDFRQTEDKQANVRVEEKWRRDIGFCEENNFIDIIKATASARIRIFHFKLINRIIATKKYLKIINVSDRDSCTFCRTSN